VKGATFRTADTRKCLDTTAGMMEAMGGGKSKEEPATAGEWDFSCCHYLFSKIANAKLDKLKRCTVGSNKKDAGSQLKVCIQGV